LKNSSVGINNLNIKEFIIFKDFSSTILFLFRITPNIIIRKIGKTTLNANKKFSISPSPFYDYLFMIPYIQEYCKVICYFLIDFSP